MTRFDCLQVCLHIGNIAHESSLYLWLGDSDQQKLINDRLLSQEIRYQ